MRRTPESFVKSRKAELKSYGPIAVPSGLAKTILSLGLSNLTRSFKVFSL
jgi:hypothetical protein